MTADALHFVGEVVNGEGRLLGEARFWGSAERSAEGAPWRGWVRVTDLGMNELPRGRYRVRAAAGWEAEFEPLAGRPARVIEIDLLPIAGVGDAPWPDQSELSPGAPYEPAWNETPPRVAEDRGRVDGFKPFELRPREGRLPREQRWPAVPDEE